MATGGARPEPVQRGTQAWREAHRGKITASDARGILARSGTRRRLELVERLVLDLEGHGLHTDEDPEPWAARHELELKAALASYAARQTEPVSPGGLILHSRYTWLGASPHALVGTTGCALFRPHWSLRAFHEAALSRPILARAQLTLLVSGRRWCEVVEFWDGGGRVPDKLRATMVPYNRAWLDEEVLPRIVALWDEIRASWKRRKAEMARGKL